MEIVIIKRPGKLADPIAIIREQTDAGRFTFVAHAMERLQQRQVTVPEVIFVLKHGHHEKRKDHFRDDFGHWVYAVRGTTTDVRKLRLAVAIDGSGLLVITVIDLDK